MQADSQWILFSWWSRSGNSGEGRS